MTQNLFRRQQCIVIPPLHYKGLQRVSFCNCPKKEIRCSHQKTKDGKIGGLFLTQWYHSFSSLLTVSSNKQCMCLSLSVFCSFLLHSFVVCISYWDQALINPQSYVQPRFKVIFQLLSKLTKLIFFSVSSKQLEL